MVLSYFALIILVVFGLFVIAGIATLCHKRTRWLGYLLLLLPVGMLAALTIWLFGFTSISSGHPLWLIFAIPIVGIVGVGALAIFVALMSNQRTRPIGLALLSMPPLLGLLLVMGMFVSFPVAKHHQYETVRGSEQVQARGKIRQHVLRHEGGDRSRDRGPSAVAASFQNVHVSVQPVAYQQLAKISNKPKAEASSPKSGRVFEALGTALGKTWGDLHRSKANSSVAAHKISPNKPTSIKNTPAKKTPPPKKIADKAKKKSAEDDKSQNDEAKQIGKIVKILSVAVRNELPENVEINQFAVLRALGSIVERMIANQKQAEEDGKEAKVVAAASKPEPKLDVKKTDAAADKSKKQPKTKATGIATGKKPESKKDTKKTSAVAVSAKKADTSNDKRPPSAKATKAPAKPAESKKAPSPVEKRPDWVDSQPQSVADGYQMVFTIDPCMTRLECDQAMDGQLAQAVSEYVELYLGREAAGKATLSPSFMRDHVIKEQWEEPFQSSFGQMIQRHARLLFDARTNTELKANYRRAIIEERLWAAGLGLGLILVLMSGCFGVLKFDEVTEGAYRARMVFALFFAVVMSIALLGTWFMTSARSVPVESEAVSAKEVSEKSPVAKLVDRFTSHKDGLQFTSGEVVGADMTNHGGSANISILPLLVLGLPACLLFVMLFFRKTRKMALILLSLGVVLVAGSLLLVV